MVQEILTICVTFRGKDQGYFVAKGRTVTSAGCSDQENGVRGRFDAGGNLPGVQDSL
jgi:hypothetical protein